MFVAVDTEAYRVNKNLRMFNFFKKFQTHQKISRFRFSDLGFINSLINKIGVISKEFFFINSYLQNNNDLPIKCN